MKLIVSCCICAVLLAGICVVIHAASPDAREKGWGIVKMATGELVASPSPSALSSRSVVAIDEEKRTILMWNRMFSTAESQMKTVGFDGKEIHTGPVLKCPSSIPLDYNEFAVSPDGAYVAYHDFDTKSIRLFDLATGADDTLVPGVGGSSLANIAWASESALIILFCSDASDAYANAVVRVALPAKTIETLHRAAEMGILNTFQIDISQDGGLLAFMDEASGEAEVCILNLKTKQATDVGPAFSHPCLSPDATQLAYIGDSGNLVVYTLADKGLETIIAVNGLVTSMRFSGKDWIVYTMDGGLLAVANLRTKKREFVLRKHAWGGIWPIENGEKLVCRWW